MTVEQDDSAPNQPAGAPGDSITAMQLDDFGAPLTGASFAPMAPKAGGLIANVTHAGVCGTDVHLQQGRMSIPLPMILGHESVGVVAALGEGADRDVLGARLSVGDRISWMSNIPCGSCFYCVEDLEPSLCESRRVYGINQSSAEWPHLSGGWAEQIYLQPGSTVIRLDDNTDSLDVVALGCAGPTATHALRLAGIRAGDIVVIQGSGPVGFAAAMMAKVAGASRVIVIGAPANRLAVAEELGVGDLLIDVEQTDAGQRLEAVLAETAANRGADVVIEATGVPSAVVEGIDMVRRGGTYLVVGQYTDHGTIPVNPHFITQKQLRVQGSWAFSSSDQIAYVQSVPSLASQFDLSALVTRYPLDRANEAVADMAAGKTLKPVLMPDRHVQPPTGSADNSPTGPTSGRER